MVRALVGLAGAFALAAGVPAAAQNQPALRGYAVLGVDAVRLGPRARVQPGAVGVTAGALQVAANAEVAGAVVADAVRLGRRARIGRLFCGLVTGGGAGAGVVGGPAVGGGERPTCQRVAKPVVDPADLAAVAVTPGRADLRVPARTAAAPIAGGAYGDVVVGPGSLLPLAGGSYQMRSIRLARTARLVCLAACRIGVAGTVRVGAHAQIGAERGLGADRARLDVAGAGAAFRSARDAVVAITVFAPAGAVRLGPAGEYRGAFVGRTVAVGARSRVSEDSAFPPPPR